MGSGMGAEALRVWDEDRRRLQGLSGGLTAKRHGEDGGGLTSRGAATLIGTAFPVPLAADMRTGPLAARRLPMRNGYGASRHVR